MCIIEKKRIHRRTFIEFEWRTFIEFETNSQESPCISFLFFWDKVNASTFLHESHNIDWEMENWFTCSKEKIA